MIPAPTTEIFVVFGLVLLAVVLFVTELIPPDTTAIAVVVSLVVLQPWTGTTANEAISGFASPATVTILAMYVLSGGVQRTGTIRRLGVVVARYTHGNKRRLLGATVGLTAPLAGFINNTPVVAMFIPMVTDLADDSHVSPSKLLIPLSYASMLGGTLTLIGTATNILASDIAVGLIGRGFTMFEFTPLGVLVTIVGLVYLVTVGQLLLPERVKSVDLTEEFDLAPYLWRVYVRHPSPIVGQSVAEALSQMDVDVDVLQIVRGDQSYIAPGSDREIRERDVLTLRGDENSVEAFSALAALRRLPRATVTEDELADPGGHGTLIEAVVGPDSSIAGNTIHQSNLRRRFGATVLAVRRGSKAFHEDLAELRLEEGDGLLLHTTDETVDDLTAWGQLVVTEVANTADRIGIARGDFAPFAQTKGPIAVAIVAAVVLLAALGYLPIVIAALGGVVAMVVTGVLKPNEAYDAVNWEVIFLLAGVIPLGIALQNSGGARFLAELVVASAGFLPIIAVLGLFYLLTSLLANVITPVASVALMLPIAVDAAGRIGGDEFAFVLGVTFAASTAFITPIGYQTNLMVYSPGGYRFTDYFRVGAPLQALLAVVTPLGIQLIWGVTV